MTRQAFEASANLPVYMAATGIAPTQVFDRPGATLPDRLANFNNTGTVRDWMIEGVIREDDYRKNALLESLGCKPPQNPPSEIDRPRHHFFDVQRGGRGLTVAGPGTIGFPAPEWALGRRGRGPSPTENQFSLPDARVYQLRSLTDGDRASRERHTALLFRTLGQVVHGLQDMAQPQHTRNDPHLGCLTPFGGESSWFEAYVETRALGETFRRRGVPSPPLVLDGYAVPAPDDYDALLSGPRGLAPFSSRNFFSAGTNLDGCAELPEPVCDVDAYRRDTVTFSIPAVGNTVVSGQVTLLRRDAVDRLSGATLADIPVSTRSLWDQHLERRGFLELFSLNTLNYDAMADVLLPRAVGYSAAFLDRFFRGRLEARAEGFYATTVGARPLRVWLTNRTPGEALGPGTVQVLYDRPGGERVTLGTWAVALAPDESATSPIEIPGVLVDQATPGRFLLVYRGPLGNEADAVVAQWIETGVTYLDLQHITNLGIESAALYVFGEELHATPTEFYFDVFARTDVYDAGESSRAFYVYRPLELIPGGLATAQLYGSCTDDVSGLPVTGEIVEAGGPLDPETLLAYRWTSPPPVVRVLGTFTVLTRYADEYHVPLDITGVRFIGVRLLSTPAPPGRWGHMCHLGATIRLPR